jgi:hypothetical protein
MNLNISILSEPTEIKRIDVILCAVLTSLIFIFGPIEIFLNYKAEWEVTALITPILICLGFFSARKSYKNDPTKIDAFYIRSWWAMISGLVAFPLCYFLRKIALDFSIVLFFFGLGPIIGNFLFNKIWN